MPRSRLGLTTQIMQEWDANPIADCGRTLLPWNFFVLVLALAAPLASKAAEPRIRCPAIEQDNYTRTNAPHEPSGPIELVVLGRYQPGKADDRSFDNGSLEVERILYGDSIDKTLGLTGLWLPDEPTQAIFALCAAEKDAKSPWAIRYSLGTDEIASQLALSRARLDYNVLSASMIFVGRAHSWNDNELRAAEDEDSNPFGDRSIEDFSKVEVLRTLLGPPIQPGTSVVVEEARGFGLVGREPSRIRLEPLTYLVSEVRAARGRCPTIYRVKNFLAASMDKQIADALARRETYPLTASDDDGGDNDSYREVLFQGTTDEAISLLSSESDAAATLGARRFIHDGAPSLTAIVAAIEAELLESGPISRGALRRQQNLIRALAIIERNHPAASGTSSKLLEKLLTAVENNAAPPQWPTNFEQSQFWKATAEPDTNHSLAWLVEQMPVKQVMDDFADRLLAMRERTDGVWKKELQLALDLQQVEDRRELAAVFEAMKAPSAVRSEQGFWSDGTGALAWSQDGKFLAEAGRDHLWVWSTSDWSLAGKVPLGGSKSRLVFSNDGSRLFVAGGGPGMQIHELVDWRTGKVEKRFVGHKTGLGSMALSARQDLMATHSYYEDKLLVWELPSGKILRDIDTDDGCSRFALRPDGRLLLRQTRSANESRQGTWVTEWLDGTNRAPVTIDTHGVSFLPDGALYTKEPRTGKKEGDGVAERLCWRHRQPEGEFPFADNTELPIGDFSSNGQFLVCLADEAGKATTGVYAYSARSLSLVSVAQNRNLHHIRIPQARETPLLSRPQEIAISPDGRTVVFGFFGDPPVLVNAESGERILPGKSHVGRLDSIRFAPDGTKLESYGSDGLKVTWDVKELRPLRREPAPRPAAPKSGQPRGELTEDGKEYFDIVGGRKLGVTITDVATKQQRKLPEVELPWRTDNRTGLVPGGKYFHVGTRIFDRQTGALVAAKRFHGCDILKMVFNHDGSRYALITGGRIFIEDIDRQWDPGTQTIVRVHETLSGKTVAAFRPKTRWCYGLTFSPDDTKLGVINDDSTIEVWTLR